MKCNRLLYAFGCVLLFATQLSVAGEFSELVDDTGISMEKDLADGVDQEVQDSFEKAVEDLQKGDSAAMNNFIHDNSSALKDSKAFSQKVDDIVAEQQQELESIAKRGENTDAALAREGQGAQPVDGVEGAPGGISSTESNVAEDAANQEKALTKDGLLGSTDYTKDPEAARVQYGTVAKTKNLIEKTEGALGKTVSTATDSLEEFATRMKTADRDILKVAKQYSVDLTNIPENALDKLGEDDAKISDLRDDLNSGDRVRIKSACKKVAKLKALSGVGDVDNIIGNFEKSGASVDMVNAMTDKVIQDVSASFDDLDTEMQQDNFFEETTEKEAGGVEHDAKGGEHTIAGKEIKTSKFQKFLDKAEKKLESGIKEQADKYVSECDLALDKLAKDGDIGTFESIHIKVKAFIRNPKALMREQFDSLATDFKTTSRYDLKDKASEVVDGVKSKIKGIGEKAAGIAEMLVSAVVFMVPNIFQSTFLAQQAKAAAMASWGNPIKYGGKVYQIPDSCINLGSPTGSWPIYAQIPVSDVGETISLDVSRMFNGAISGPTTNNSLASAIHNASSEIFSFGTVLDTTINRYKMNESKFLPLTDMVVVYGGPGAYVTPGSIAMNSSQFTGQVISLRTGMVTDATGDLVDATGFSSAKDVPLISVTQWGSLSPSQTSPVSQGLQSVREFLPSILAKTEVADSKVTYTQYSNVSSGSKGQGVSEVIQDLLNTDCVSSEGSLTNSNCSSVIVDGLDSLSAGININSTGDVATVFKVSSSTPQQFLSVTKDSVPVIKKVGALVNKMVASSVAENHSSVLGRLGATSVSKTLTATPPPATSTGWSGLGAVLPVFGWGTNNIYNNIFTSTTFPGFDPSAAGITNVERVGSIAGDNLVTAGAGVTGEASTSFASDDELWVAKGCWIYLSANTPFAQYIQQGVITSQSLVGPYVDYIVFMDEDYNIVPLMVSVTVDVDIDNGSSSYKKAQMYLNPAIKYWTSLIAYNLEEFASAGQSIMYDLQGNEYQNSALGVLASAAPAAGSQGPTGIIPTFLTGQSNSIQTGFPEIYNQFQLHSAALIDRMSNMPIPYANCSLTTSDANNLTIGKSTLTTYTGLNCWESSIGGDYLVPVNIYPYGKTTEVQTLPSSDAQYLLSLVTDIVYELQNNSWVPFDFTNSMLNLDTSDQPVKKADGLYEVNASLESQFYFMSGFFDDVTPPASLVADLTSKRVAWLKNMGVATQIGSGSSAITCNLAAGLSVKSVKVNGSYIYQLNPSPTAALVGQQDYFVAVAASAPILSSLKPISMLQAASENGTLVSLLTGTLYDMTGTPIMHEDGLPKRITISTSSLEDGETSAQLMYRYITDTLFKNLPSEFKLAYQSAVKEYSVVQKQPKGPYTFGQFSVAIRSGDLANGTYVYFSASGMHKSNFKPRDLYVILTQATSGNGYVVSQYDATQTQYLLSLITGVAYDQNGQLAMMLPAANLQSMIAGWSVGWSPWILTNLKAMQDAYAADLARYAADDDRVEKELEEFANEHDAALNQEKSAIAAIISRLEPAGSGLPIPFPGLQYDATTEQYVHPSPAGTSVDNGLIYLFMGSGEVYGQDGTYHTQYQPAHLQAVRDQYGVVVDPKTKAQTLGIPMMQPSLLLSEQDQELTIGTSGQSMITSTDENFPGGRIAMSAGYGLFFSKIMDTYYVLNSQVRQWMSIDGGHLYEQDGAPVVIDNRVAVAGKDDLMLLYQNNSGYEQAFMSDGSEYSNLSSSNSSMSWMGLSAPYTELTVTANAKLTQYAIGKKNYKVDSSYAWYSLILVPIDDNGALLSVIPDSSYRFVQLVLNDNSVTNLLYHGVMYKVVSVASNTYTMQPVKVESGVSTITLTIGLVDAGTNAPYISIMNGSETYKYCFEPQSYDVTEQIANRANIWTGATSASPVPLAVGPMHKKSKQVGGQTLTMSVPDYVTHTLFTRDLPAKGGAIITPVVVSARAVDGAPSVKTDPTGYATLQLGLQNVFVTKDNRFLCGIGAWTATPTAGILTFPYVSKAAYVDLATGALFDQVSGVAKGQSLNMKDFIAVLDYCAVMVSNKTISYPEGTGKNKYRVTKNQKGKNILVYRSSDISQQQVVTIESNS